MTLTPSFVLTADSPGAIKVRLFYHTREAKHVRSRVLRTDFNADPPYVEDVSVLLPPTQIFNRLSAFDSIFAALQKAGILALSDKLRDFEIRDEDTYTLAWMETDSL